MLIYYINLHVINFYEEILNSIYLFLFYLYLKYEGKASFEINYLYLLISCLFQVTINIILKYIIYILDEMHAIIPLYLAILKEIVCNL